MPPELLREDQIAAAMHDLPGWEARSGTLFRSVRAPDFMTGIRLVQRVAEVAEEINHHPDMGVQWTTVSFTLWTHVSRGITRYDVELAYRISATIDEVLGT